MRNIVYVFLNTYWKEIVQLVVGEGAYSLVGAIIRVFLKYDFCGSFWAEGF